MIAVEIDSGSGRRRIDLFDYLEPAREEQAHEDAYAWIKAIRHCRADGESVRSRFTFRGDSLWWFAELFVHKEQAILNTHRIVAAVDALVERERPRAIRYLEGRLAGVLAEAANAKRIAYEGPSWANATTTLLRMDARASALFAAAHASRLRTGAAQRDRARVAAFVHRAFWRGTSGDGSAESYIGPVLRQLESRVGRDAVRYVGVGPRSNFRARRWWDPVVRDTPQGLLPIEQFAPSGALAESRELFWQRHAIRAALQGSADLRAHAVIRGCDCWPLVRDLLGGVALLQFPWSGRAMDEAAAALRALEPDVAMTYAEAGGWGRALALECRRLRVPLAALQHGFIYRHWLNYRHEPDETQPDVRNTSDRGFPFPALTLLFDEQAARQLTVSGHFPADAVRVSGSARLDELHAAITALEPSAIERARRDAGAADGRPLLLFAAKEREARRALPALVAAVAATPAIQLAIKPHPAETPAVYAGAIAGVGNIRVLAAEAPLPPLLAAAAAVVTVNSTVAIDALALGTPAIVIGLPNNLTPFVDAGLMRGAGTAEEITAAFTQVLYDQKLHTTGENGTAPVDGQAAARSAEAILRLVPGDRGLR